MIAALGRRATGQSHQLRFGAAIDRAWYASIGTKGSCEGRMRAGMYEFLPNAYDLPRTEADLLGNLTVGKASLRMRLVGQQQNLCASYLRYARRSLTRDRYKFRTLIRQKQNLKLQRRVRHPCLSRASMELAQEA